VIVPFAAATIWGLDDGANVAQLVSVPLAAAGLLGISLIRPKSTTSEAPDEVSRELSADAPAEAHEPSPLKETPLNSAPPLQGSHHDKKLHPRRRPERRPWTGLFMLVVRGVGVLLGTSLAVASVLIWIDSARSIDQNQSPSASSSTTTGTLSLMAQPIVVTEGTPPLAFEGGTSWRWLDLPVGKSTVSFSPGGGAKNHGLVEIGGDLAVIGSCGRDMISWDFFADGKRLITEFYSGYHIDLPDDINVLTLEFVVTDPHVPCTIGFQWDNPSVIRRGPIPE